MLSQNTCLPSIKKLKLIQSIMLSQCIDILGVPVSFLNSNKHAIDCIANRIQSGQKTRCVVIDPEKIYHAQQKQTLHKLINSADIDM